jgi:hypothetical protein
MFLRPVGFVRVCQLVKLAETAAIVPGQPSVILLKQFLKRLPHPFAVCAKGGGTNLNSTEISLRDKVVVISTK